MLKLDLPVWVFAGLACLGILLADLLVLNAVGLTLHWPGPKGPNWPVGLDVPETWVGRFIASGYCAVWFSPLKVGLAVVLTIGPALWSVRGGRMRPLGMVALLGVAFALSIGFLDERLFHWSATPCGIDVGLQLMHLGAVSAVLFSLARGGVKGARSLRGEWRRRRGELGGLRR